MAYPERLTIPGAQLERWSAAAHTASFVEACADPAVMEFLGGPMGREAAEEISAELEDHWSVFGFGLWAVVAEDGRTAGFAGACRALWHRDHAALTEVGWRLARWAWGRGFATNGGRLGAGAAFSECGLDEVVAFVHPDNHRSIAVIDRLGMRFSEMTDDMNLGQRIRIYRLRAPGGVGP